MIVANIIGGLAVLVAVVSVIANLILGVEYDLNKPNHPVAKTPKHTSNPNRTKDARSS